MKQAFSEGMISPVRYENYKQFFEEISSRKKYYKFLYVTYWILNHQMNVKKETALFADGGDNRHPK